MSKEKVDKKGAKAEGKRPADSDKMKQLNALKDLVNKKFGENSIMLMDKTRINQAVEVTSTGSLQLDMAIGVGGVPVGRIVEIYGPEASGKTTLTLHLAVETQKKGGTVAFIDAEHALDFAYAQRLGLKMEEVLLAQPNSGEEALDIADQLAQSGLVSLIIIDSVSALTPKAELEGSMEDQQMGGQARMLGKALRKITPYANQNKCTIIFINQLREKIGVMYGSPETTSGGKALKFFASLRLDIRKDSKTTESGGKISGIMKVTIKKNKVAPPSPEPILIPVVFGEGIDMAGEVYKISAKVTGLIEVRGGTNLYRGSKAVILKDGSTLEPGVKIGGSAPEAMAFVKANQNLFEILRSESMDKMKEILANGGSAEESADEVME